jgi:uncharacterized protein (TIGR00255 family)
MSVVSMTGFGRGEARGRGLKVVVELGAVNRRQFDCHVTLPRDLAAIEARIHALVHAAVRRGHVKGSLEAVRVGRGAVAVDLALARARLGALRRAARRLGLADDLTVATLLDWPDVVRGAGDATLCPDAVWPLAERATRAAIRGLTAMRRREGRALAGDLVSRLARLRRIAAAIGRRAPGVIVDARAALERRIAAANGGLKLDDSTLAREVAAFADRSDIREELTRLDSHFAQARALFAGAESCGRSLDFLCQEIFREINTIGSKAGDAAISRHVVAFKAELEAVREQAQNVE